MCLLVTKAGCDIRAHDCTSAESEGNVDNFAYTYVPDMKVPLVRQHVDCPCWNPPCPRCRVFRSPITVAPAQSL